MGVCSLGRPPVGGLFDCQAGSFDVQSEGGCAEEGSEGDAS